MFTLLLALLLRLFLFNFYVVPTDSMAPSIVSGDFILAEKLSFGARIFTGLQFDRNSDPSMTRIQGLRLFRRNDVAVFNFPYRYERDSIRMNLEQIFVKRIIGLPGDSLSIVDGFYIVAGLVDTLGYIPGQHRLKNYYNTLDSEIMRTYPFDGTINWDIMNFGPLYIPAAETTIALTPHNFKLYAQQIVFETNAVVRHEDSLTFINDSLWLFYTFRRNWYFMAGDDIMYSQDSRYIGLIPEDYIIGKAWRVISSKDRHTGKRRWSRFLKKINWISPIGKLH